ncbi:MAG: IclR family transcriptional regulator [Gemmatimonadota bacterium]
MLKKLEVVLSLFTADRPELTGPEIAKALKRPKSTVYRLLGAVTAVGFLERDPDTARYRLGIRLATLGDLARQSTSLQRLGLRALRQVTDEVKELSTLFVLMGKAGINIDVVESKQMIMLPGLIGTPQPLHVGAGGKVLLAWKLQDEVASLLGTPLRRFTRTTITDPKAFFAELATVRKRGWAMSDGEHNDEIVGVAAPVRDHRGEVIAALTTGCPRSRATTAHVDEMVNAVMTAADELSATLGYHPQTFATNPFRPGAGGGAGLTPVRPVRRRS